MLTNEVTSNANNRMIDFHSGRPIRAIEPWQYPWQFYSLTGQQTTHIPHYFSKSHKVAITTIGNRLILWSMFSFGTKYGEFYEIDPKFDMHTIAKKDNRFVLDDVKAAWLYAQWDRARPEKRAAIAGEFLKLQISPLFRRTKQPLYRGMRMSDEAINRLKSNAPVKLQPRIVSSWSEYRDSTAPFLGRKKNGPGVLITATIPKESIIVNLESLDKFFHGVLQTERWVSEFEVLVHGTGIGPILDPRRVHVELANWEDL